MNNLMGIDRPGSVFKKSLPLRPGEGLKPQRTATSTVGAVIAPNAQIA